MQRSTLETIVDLNAFLAQNTHWANGKNIALDHLHQTGAQSRWMRENIYGIYLTQPDYTWMAVWMAITDRTKAAKRNLTYVRPQYAHGDYIGELLLYTEDQSPAHCMHDCYLYTIDPAPFSQHEIVDIRSIADTDLVATLTARSIEEQTIIRHQQPQRNYASIKPEPRIVLIDEWQLTITGVPIIIPEKEIVLSANLIAELYATRVTPTNTISTQHYLQEKETRGVSPSGIAAPSRI
jgi:hypothetical protein